MISRFLQQREGGGSGIDSVNPDGSDGSGLVGSDYGGCVEV